MYLVEDIVLNFVFKVKKIFIDKVGWCDDVRFNVNLVFIVSFYDGSIKNLII